jgi:L-ascorbate metabolism protein UlaG (beta-lactamase superfamily)
VRAGQTFFRAGAEHFAEINKRLGPFRLALLPIGAYLPRWFMHPVHLSPGEAAELHDVLKPRVSMAIHFGTFALGDDGEFEPVAELRRALNTESRFWVLEQGEGRDVP